MLGLRCCGAGGRYDCASCPFEGASRIGNKTCTRLLHEAAIEYINSSWEEVLQHKKAYYIQNRERIRQWYAEKYRRNREEILRRQKLRRDLRRAQGLCISCGKPAREGKTMCEACAQRNKVYAIRMRMKKAAGKSEE